MSDPTEIDGPKRKRGRPATKLSRNDRIEAAELGTKPPRRFTAETILSFADEFNLWLKLLKSKNERIRLATLQYLTDRRDGKPIQAVATGEDVNKAYGNLHIQVELIGQQGPTGKPN